MDWLKVRSNREEQRLFVRDFTTTLTCYLEEADFDKLDLDTKQETLLHIDACGNSDQEILGEIFGMPSVCRSYSASLFASCYHSDGQFDEAEELYKRALAGNEEKLGPQHSDTLRTVHNLAIVYRNKGRYDEAKELYKRALAGNEEKLGPEHPNTLRTVEGLALVYDNKGQYDEAEELYKRALAGNEEKLGPEHPNTLRTVEGLALVYRNKGQYDEAEELYK
ncbi:hypothetical protein MMC10_011424 [Thelotrema lepadinum]|nr:hypothetical protein [Thelotrema lepadinum]